MIELLLPYLKEITIATSGAIAVWMYQKVSKIITNRKYKISGTYITTYADIVNGNQTREKTLSVLKQNGFSVRGKTHHQDGRAWQLNGEFLNGRYYCGVYTADAKHDLGVGSFYFEYNGKDFDGMWTGYDNLNRETTTGYYKLKRIKHVKVKDMGHNERSFAVNLALKLRIDHLVGGQKKHAISLSNKTLGPDYLNMSSFELDYGKGITLAAKFNGKMVGFVISYIMNANKAHEILFQNCSGVKISPDVSNADRQGQLGVIKTIAVDPEFQGCGIGTRLVVTAENRLRRKNAAVILIPAWQQGTGQTNMEGVLKHLKYEPWEQCPLFWKQSCDEKEFTCPSRDETKGCTCNLFFHKKTLTTRG